MKPLIAAISVTAFVASVPPPADRASEAAVISIVESVATLADRREFEALERLYADEVVVDYSSLSGEPADLKSPERLMTEWASVLPGFDRTRHSLSNIAVSVDGSSAQATAKVVAGHWINGDYWEVTGHYAYVLVEADGDWRITEITFTLEEETGSRDVFVPAMAAAKANPVPYLER